MDRALFLKSTLAALSTNALPSPNPPPSATPSGDAWDLCDQNPALPYNRPLEIKMRVLDGPDFDLVKYRGNPVLINVFASWCGPCQDEMPYIVKSASVYASRGLRVIGINAEESDDTVRGFRSKLKIPFPIAMDGDGGFVMALENGGKSDSGQLPVSLFVRPDGYLYCYQIGGMSREELRYRIEKFLKDMA